MPGPELYRQSLHESALRTLPRLSGAGSRDAGKSGPRSLRGRAARGSGRGRARRGARQSGLGGRGSGGAEGAGCAVAADGHLKWPRGVRDGFPGLGVIRVAPEVGPVRGGRGTGT